MKLNKILILIFAFVIGTVFALTSSPDKAEAVIMFSCVCPPPGGGGGAIPPDKSQDIAPSPGASDPTPVRATDTIIQTTKHDSKSQNETKNTSVIAPLFQNVYDTSLGLYKTISDLFSTE